MNSHADVQARGKDGKELQTVVASDQPDVIRIQSETVLVHDDPLRRRHGHSSAAATLEALKFDTSVVGNAKARTAQLLQGRGS